MERAENTAVVVSDFGWSDIGSWKAISELYESDAGGNRIEALPTGMRHLPMLSTRPGLPIRVEESTGR